MQGGGAIVGAERPAQCAFDALRHLGKGHFAVERRKNGAADKGRAAQTGQDSAAKPLYGDTAAIDHRSLGAIDGKWRLVTEIDDPGLASIAAPAWRPLAQPCVPPNSIDIRQDPRPIQTHVFVPFKGTIPEHGVAAHMEIRESEARRRPATVSNVNGEQISRSFLAAWERRRVPRDRLSRVAERRQPPLAPTIQCIRYSQNVAGMWLKCGQRPET